MEWLSHSFSISLFFLKVCNDLKSKYKKESAIWKEVSNKLVDVKGQKRKERLILDLSIINQNILKYKFKYGDYKNALEYFGILSIHFQI